MGSGNKNKQLKGDAMTYMEAHTGAVRTMISPIGATVLLDEPEYDPTDGIDLEDCKAFDQWYAETHDMEPF